MRERERDPHSLWDIPDKKYKKYKSGWIGGKRDLEKERNERKMRGIVR